MKFAVNHTAGVGDSEVYVRLRNGGQYLKWSDISWQVAEDSGTKLFTTEYYSDPVDSLYEVEHDVPTGVWVYEMVLDSTGEVIYRDLTAIDSLGSPLQTDDNRIPATIIAARADIPTAVAIRQEMDANSTALQSIIGMADTVGMIFDACATIDEHVLDIVSTLGGAIHMNGSNACTLTVLKTATVLPLTNVYISVYNSDETTLFGVVATDANGETKDGSGDDLVLLDPDADGFVLYLRKNGYLFARTVLSNAELLAGSKTIYGDAFIPADPPAAELQTLYMYVAVLDWSPSVNVVVSANLQTDNQVVNGAFIQGVKTSDIVDSSGWAQLFLPIGANVTIKIPKAGEWNIQRVSEHATRNLADYVSAGEAVRA